MAEMMILHFLENNGNSEYVVFTEDVKADTEDFKRPGYTLINTILISNFPRHSLPLESDLMKE